MGAKNENIHTMPTDSCLFCLFLCLSESTLEELKKGGEESIKDLKHVKKAGK